MKTIKCPDKRIIIKLFKLEIEFGWKNCIKDNCGAWGVSILDETSGLSQMGCCKYLRGKGGNNGINK